MLLTFLVGDSVMGGDMRRRIAQVAPHAQRAVMINRTIEYKKSQAATFADTLDGLSAGVFLVDAQCRIVHANVAGQELLDEDDVLRSIGGQLVARDRQTNHGLREGIANVRSGIEADSAAFSLTAQVLNTTRSGVSPSAAFAYPASSSSPATRSESCAFIWHP